MRKNALYMLLSLAAFLAILVACGSGEVIDLSEGSPEYSEILSGGGMLGNLAGGNAFIDNCGQDIKSDSLCVALNQERPSSSSVPSSSSLAECVDLGDCPSSSSAAIIDNSSSSVVQSSSSVVQSSSSSPPPPDCVVKADFSCGWNPPSVVGGNEATKIFVDDYENEGYTTCNKVAYIPTRNPFSQVIESKEYLTIAEDITPRFGEFVKGQSGTKWPALPDIPGALVSFSGLWGQVTCTGEDQQELSVCGECTNLSIKRAPNAVVEGEIEWINAHSFQYSTNPPIQNIFYIGETPTWNGNKVKVTGPNAIYCGNIMFRLKLNGQLLPGNFPLLTATHASNTNKTLEIEAYCEGSGQILRTAVAAVVPNPTLGSCTWNKDRLAVGTMATPTATLSNAYGRCGDGNGTISYSGASGSATKPFPRTLELGDVGTVTGVKATACSGAWALESTCSALTVVEFENELAVGSEAKKVDQGKAYTLIAACPSTDPRFALICPYNASSEGCSVKIGTTTYSGGHNNSPGCYIDPSPIVGNVIEIIKANGSGNQLDLKCQGTWLGTACTKN